MKPFNLQEALAGKPVVTRDGTKKTLIVSHIPGHIIVASMREIRSLVYMQEFIEQRGWVPERDPNMWRKDDYFGYMVCEMEVAYAWELQSGTIH